MFPNNLSRHYNNFSRHYSSNTFKTLTSQPVTRFVFAGTLFLSLLLLFWSASSIPSAKHLFKSGPPPRPHDGPFHYGPGSPQGSASHIGEPSSTALRNWKKPPGLKIIGLVFYGRKEFVEVLDCYLKRNLVVNGGVMDEVIFAVHTENKGDLEYLDYIVNSTEGYRKHEQEKQFDGWVGPWELVERGNIYMKIDDDVLFFEDDAIVSIAKRMVENPHYFAVSANSVNNPALSWIHYGLGVYEPYMPELTPPPLESHSKKDSWRASQLPEWTGPENFTFDARSEAPFEGHRWLPVPPSTRDIVDTPAGRLTYDSHGPGWRDWTIAAQTHYSFLQHLEEQSLWRYKFNIWDYHYYRISVNFIGFWGDDIVDAFPFPIRDDEEYLTMVRPKELNRHVVLDGTVLSVHFAFGPQRLAKDPAPEDSIGGLYHTDLLKRYKAYAAEMVCPYPKRGQEKKGGFW